MAFRMTYWAIDRTKKNDKKELTGRQASLLLYLNLFKFVMVIQIFDLLALLL